MVTWYVFPDRQPALKYRRDSQGTLHYVLNLAPGRNDLATELAGQGWEALEGKPTLFNRPFPQKGSPGVLPLDIFRRLRASRTTFNMEDPRDRQRFLALHGLRPCPEDALPVGFNRQGDEVHEHRGHRWIGGRAWHHHESLHPPAHGLRFTRQQDYLQLAAALVEECRKNGTTFAREDLEKLAAATVQPCPSWPQFRPATGREQAIAWLMNDLFLQVCQSPVQAGEARNWAEIAMIQEKIDLDYGPSGGWSPLLALATREILKGTENFPTAGIAPVRFQDQTGDGSHREGSHQPAHAADRFIVQGTNPLTADRFFLDLRTWPVDDAGDALMAHLEARPAKGVTAVLLPSGQDIDGEWEVQGILREVACTFGIEAGCWIGPELDVSGIDGRGVLALSIGECRPNRLDNPPAVAVRLPNVGNAQELQRWYYDARHGRQRLHELLSGVEPEAMSNRQVPYQPMSSTGNARTMISKGQQGAFEAAKRKFIRNKGSSDDYVAGLLGIDRETMADHFSPEQIDAIALSEWAHERDRAFILADQTGAGKGRSMIGAAASWLNGNPRNRVIYMTQSTNLMSDVLRDIRDTGTAGVIGRVGLLGSTLPAEDDIPISHYTNAQSHDGVGFKARLFLSGEWPEANRLIISTYSTFQNDDVTDENTEHPEIGEWLDNITSDGHTMVILDECHKGLNPTSNTGKAVRRMCDGAGRIMFASATFLRDYNGSDIYNYCLPPEMQHTTQDLYNVPETVQEYMTTMLIEDGVYLRRDHDLMEVPRKTLLPNESEMDQNRAVDMRFRQLGQDIARFRAQFRFIHGSEWTISNPLPHLAASIVNLSKVPQTLRIAREAINRGRKPQIFVSETGGSWMTHLREQAGGDWPDARHSFKDYIRFKVRQMYWAWSTGGGTMTLDDDNAVPALRNIMIQIEEDINALPDDLPPSPIDALKHGLADAGITVGELTGRDMQFNRQGLLQARPMSGKEDRTAIGNAYNGGDLDVIIFNKSVSTGHSYHADPRFKDQRPRSIIIMDTDSSIIDTLQSEGRGNRFNQVAIPEILVVATGLAAEMRKVSYYNRKLHALGAIVDSNRDHPALQDSIPDMCNPVGEIAVRRTLLNNRFADLRSMFGQGTGDVRWTAGIELPANGHTSVSSLLNLLPFLEEDRQKQVMDHVVHEYGLRLAELEELGRNPLKTRSLDGHVTLEESSRFFMDENELEGLSEESAFNQPAEIHNALWHRPYPMGINVIRDKAAANLRKAMPTKAMADHIRAINTLSADPVDAATLRGIIDGTTSFVPGTVVRTRLRDVGIILEHEPPKDRDSHLWIERLGHRFSVIMSGDERPTTWTLANLMGRGAKAIGNMVEDTTGRLERLFLEDADRRSQSRVQVITGNALNLKGVMRNTWQQDFKIMNVRMENGQSVLAAVNQKPLTYNYANQPVRISAASLWKVKFGYGQAVQYRKSRSEDGYERTHAFITITRKGTGVEIKLPNMSADALKRFWNVDTGKEIYRLVTGSKLDEDLPAIRKDMSRIKRRVSSVIGGVRPDDIAKLQTLMALFDQHGEVELNVNGTNRDRIREACEKQPQPEIVSWANVVKEGGTVAGLISAAETTWKGHHGGRHSRAAQPVLALTGRNLPGKAMLQLTGGNLTLVTLPPYSKRTRNFWESPDGKELWRLVNGRNLPKRIPRNARPIRTCIDGGDRKKILAAMIRVAETNGNRLAVPAELARQCIPDKRPRAAAC